MLGLAGASVGIFQACQVMGSAVGLGGVRLSSGEESGALARVGRMSLR